MNKSLRAIDIPEAIKRLPVTDTGFPVPWFVQWFLDGKPSDFGVGKPDLRITDHIKRHNSDGSQCWICGEQLGEQKSFLAGANIFKSRVHDEPPSHRDCAIFAAKACPFIAKPSMHRNRKDMPIGVVDNRRDHPDVYCVWTTSKFHTSTSVDGKKLWHVGDSDETLWFSEGKPVTKPHFEEEVFFMRAPVMLLKDVFDKELCNKLIDGFENNGGSETGYAGADGSMVVDHSIKRRRDWVIEDQALGNTLNGIIGGKVLRPLFRSTWFPTQKAERFAVARYDVGGHFSPHVDISQQTQHRRFAVSLGLNDNFRGGELSFPDFNEEFRIERGEAVVFSCGLMHGVKPVTDGRRYVFLTFLF